MKTLLYKAGLFIICIVCYCKSIAQDSYIDSLKIDSLKKVLGNIYKKKDDKANVASTYWSIGRIYDKNIGNSNEALKYYDSALSIYKKINNKQGIADTYRAIAAVYADNNFSEAIKYYYAALPIYEETGDKINMGKCYQFIGAGYSNLQNDSAALKFCLLALKIRKETGNKNDIAQSLLTVGEIYNHENKYGEAMLYDSMGYAIYKELGSKGYNWGIPYSLENIGVNYTSIGDMESKAGNEALANKNYAKALDYYLPALENWKKIGRKDAYSLTNSNLGCLYLKLHDIPNAIKYLKEGVKEDKNFNGKIGLFYNYQTLVILDSLEGNYKLAYEHYKLYILYRDSIYNEETTKKTLQTSMQYDFDKKEAVAKAVQDKKDADAKRIKNQQYFDIAALGIVVLAVVIIALIQFRNNKHKQKANLLLERQKQKVENTLTELKSTQAQLIQSEKMASLGELTAGIAHEIQNPLNFVNNFSEVNGEMIDEAAEELAKGNIEEVKSILNDIKVNEEKINHHGKRADAIVKGMLQHPRQTKGMKESIDINALCDEYLRLSYHGLRAKDKNFNADFKTEFDESIGKINIVPQDIGRVLLNLFNNAFYATNEKKKTASGNYKPTVSVQTKKIHDKVEIIVKDTGNGVPQNIIDKIFQPFFTTKPTGSGTGLGLSLSYDIIKVHGGEIKAESKEGDGSIFIITIPA